MGGISGTDTHPTAECSLLGYRLAKNARHGTPRAGVATLRTALHLMVVLEFIGIDRVSLGAHTSRHAKGRV